MFIYISVHFLFQYRCVLHATILNSRAEAYSDMLEGDVIAEMALHNPQLVKVSDLIDYVIHVVLYHSPNPMLFTFSYILYHLRHPILFTLPCVKLHNP